MTLTTIQLNSLLRTIAEMRQKIDAFSRFLNGQPIANARIDNLSASKITSGTLTLVDGVDGARLVVLDSVGNEIIEVNKDGITIQDGNIIIYDNLGRVAFDARGLVGVNNFQSDFIQSLQNTRTTSSDSFVDVSDTSLAFHLDGESRLEFKMSGDFANAVGSGEICSEYVALNIDGVLYPDASNGFGNVFFIAAGSDPTTVLATWSGFHTVTLPAGDHTAKLQFRKQGVYPGEIDARVINTYLSYLKLGN